MKIIPNYLTQQILISGLVGLVSGFLNAYIMRYFSRLFEPAFDILFSFTVPGLVFGVCISLYLVFASQLSFAKSVLFAIMITPTWTAAAVTSFIMFETWVGSYFPTPWSEFVNFLMGREELSRDIIISGPGMLLTGLIAGFVGAVGLVIVSAIILPSFRRLWLCGVTILVGTVAGATYASALVRIPIPISLEFITWQTLVSICFGLGVATAKRIRTQQSN